MIPGWGLMIAGSYGLGALFYLASIGLLIVLSWAGLIFLKTVIFLYILIYILVAVISGIYGWKRKYLSINGWQWCTRVASFLFLPLIIVTIAIYKPVLLGWQLYQIPSPSMSPVLRVGDIIIADARPWVLNNVSKGDIMIFYPPNSNNYFYIKRVIGVGGDTILIENGQLAVNGKVQLSDLATKTMSERSIAEGHFFMMGDNHVQSRDSRYWGDVSEEKLVAKYVRVIFRNKE